MKKHINTRIELLLAKIAGRKVDLSTMTPPVAMNLTEELMLDIADRMDGASSELPTVTATDNGDVLTVVEGAWAKAAPPASGIPVPASPSNGDVLTYNSTSEEWEAKAPSGGGSSLPAYTPADIGKILAVDASFGDAIMEETTVTLVYDETDYNYQAELASGFDFSNVSDGDDVFIIYNGYEFGSIANVDGSVISISSTAISFDYNNGTLTVIGDEGGEVTVALYLADNEHPRLIWKTDGGIK